jgi:hypothetical protein
VPDHPARRLWVALETLHDVTYFAKGVRPAGIALGLRGFWMTYFAFRAAPLGPVPAGPVVAAFAGFQPAMVAKALPDAWSRTTPRACLDARARVSAVALREAGADPDACDRAAAILGPVAAAADPTGRPLFAANAAVAPPGDALGRLWQLATTLREHRGDGHIAAMVNEGITGLEAHLLQAAAGRFPQVVIRQVRGCSEGEWSVAADALSARGLLSRDGTASPDDAAAAGDALGPHPGRPSRPGYDRGAHRRAGVDRGAGGARRAGRRGGSGPPRAVGARGDHVRHAARLQPDRSALPQLMRDH